MKITRYHTVTITHMRSKTATDEQVYFDATVQFTDDGWVHVTGQQPIPREATRRSSTTDSFPRKKVLAVRGHERRDSNAGEWPAHP